MKKLILLLLFIPLVLIGQENNTNVSIKSGGSVVSKAIDRNQEIRDRQGINYLGDGIYEIIRVGGSSVRKNKEKFMMENFNIIVNELVIEKEAKSFKIIFKDFGKMMWLQQPAILTAKVKLLDGKGNPKLEKNESKEDAKKQLLELKEFLELGIITQEEFDKKAVSLKKILLGN